MEPESPPATGTWWRLRLRRPIDSDDGENDSNPIDTQEQEEMVRSFERNQARQSRRWRRVFAGFMLGYVAFLIYSIYQQTFFPWEMRHHAFFMEDMHVWAVILADWVAVMACLLAVKGLLHSSKSRLQWMWYSFYVGLLLAVVWLIYMFRLPRFRWDLIWLPLGPVSGTGICLYVDHLLLESLEDVKKLRNCMYTYKSL